MTNTAPCWLIRVILTIHSSKYRDTWYHDTTEYTKGNPCYCYQNIIHFRAFNDPIPKPWSFAVSWTARCAPPRTAAGQIHSCFLPNKHDKTHRFIEGVSRCCHIKLSYKTFESDPMPHEQTWKSGICRMNSCFVRTSTFTEFYSLNIR